MRVYFDHFLKDREKAIATQRTAMQNMDRQHQQDALHIAKKDEAIFKLLADRRRLEEEVRQMKKDKERQKEVMKIATEKVKKMEREIERRDSEKVKEKEALRMLKEERKKLEETIKVGLENVVVIERENENTTKENEQAKEALKKTQGETRTLQEDMRKRVNEQKDREAKFKPAIEKMTLIKGELERERERTTEAAMTSQQEEKKSEEEMRQLNGEMERVKEQLAAFLEAISRHEQEMKTAEKCNTLFVLPQKKKGLDEENVSKREKEAYREALKCIRTLEGDVGRAEGQRDRYKEALSRSLEERRRLEEELRDKRKASMMYTEASRKIHLLEGELRRTEKQKEHHWEMQRRFQAERMRMEEAFRHTFLERKNGNDALAAAVNELNITKDRLGRAEKQGENMVDNDVWHPGLYTYSPLSTL